MNRDTFVLLCTELGFYLRKLVTRLRYPVPVNEQVTVTIWRLATNIEYRTVSALFGLGISTVCTIVNCTCYTISRYLIPKYVGLPWGQKLREIISELETFGGFPQAAGATCIDGTHIPILKPQESSSDYYNRKGFYSISMQAVVSSNGYFLDVNIGWPGKVHNARVLANSSLYHKA